MESKVVGVCAVIAVLGILSAAAGFAAEVTKIKASDVYIDSKLDCVYPNNPAFGLGIAAIVFAIMTLSLISVAVGCCSCCRSDPKSNLFNRLFYVLSWIATVIAVVLLVAATRALAATALNDGDGGERSTANNVTCYVVKSGIFTAGAVLSLLSAIFGIAAYVSISSVTQTTTTPVVALPVATNFDIEKLPPQQFPSNGY